MVFDITCSEYIVIVKIISPSKSVVLHLAKSWSYLGAELAMECAPLLKAPNQLTDNCKLFKTVS